MHTCDGRERMNHIETSLHSPPENVKSISDFDLSKAQLKDYYLLN